MILCNINGIWDLDFDVRVGTVNRGGQTRRRTVPGRPADGFSTGSGHGSSGRGVVVRGAGFSVVAVVAVTVASASAAAAAVEPQRADGPGGRVPDDDPRAPDHGEGQHFQRLGRRYGHHVVSASGQHGHRARYVYMRR